MTRLVAMCVLSGLLLGSTACTSSSSSSGEVKPLPGKRIPEAAGKSKSSPPKDKG